MIATVTIGTVSVQGALVRLLPGGLARVVAHGRVHTGRLVPRLRRIVIHTTTPEGPRPCRTSV